MSVHWTAGYASAAPYPMTHARILHTPLAGTVTATSAVEGFAASNAASPNTYSYWQPSAMPADWLLVFGSPQVVDAVGIGASTLGGRTITVATLSGGSYTDRITLTETGVGAQSCVLTLFQAVTCDAVRVRFSGSVPYVGVIYAGQAMAMERAEFSGLGQLDYSRRTEFEQNVSEGGQWLGRSIARVSNEASFGWEYLTPEFVRDSIEPFSRAARQRPFFIAPMPSKVATDCHLAWVRQDIRPARMGIKGFQRVAFDATGYARN
jgi:hypothetical protein